MPTETASRRNYKQRGSTFVVTSLEGPCRFILGFFIQGNRKRLADPFLVPPPFAQSSTCRRVTDSKLEACVAGNGILAKIHAQQRTLANEPERFGKGFRLHLLFGNVPKYSFANRRAQ